MLHQKELIGRLFGRKITPRQFELLMGMDEDGSLKKSKMLDHQQNTFMSNEDYVRLTQEKYEKIMRQKVASGEWTESEKLNKLQEQIEEDVEKAPSKSEFRINVRNFEENMRLFREIDNPEVLMTKQYHFDEGCGMSLQ